MTLNRLSRIREAQGDLAGALACFEEAVALSRAVVAARGTPQDQRDLCATLYRIGSIRVAQGDRRGARLALSQACKALELVVKRRGTPQDRQELAQLKRLLALVTR